MKKIYFDNNATTPVDPAAREAMLPYLGDIFGNPSSGHEYGEAAKDGIEAARKQVAALIGCAVDRVIFTSGGTEANNLAILSSISAYPDKKHIISSSVEHPSVLSVLKFLKQNQGYEIEYLPVGSSGGIDLQVLASFIRDETVLVSLIGANNETGVLWPIAEIGEICSNKDVLFHSDTVQMAGKKELNVGELPVDYISLASHKLYGPKGAGALYVRRGVSVTPLVMGGGQEGGRRAGTENVPGIVGFGKACEIGAQKLTRYSGQMKTLVDRLAGGILENIPDVLINGQNEPRLANTLNVSFKHASSAAMIQDLEVRGIAVSAISACHSGDQNPSQVLVAMGVPEPYLHGALRISLGRYNTAEEVEAFLDILPDVVARSRTGFAVFNLQPS